MDVAIVAVESKASSLRLRSRHRSQCRPDRRTRDLPSVIGDHSAAGLVYATRSPTYASKDTSHKAKPRYPSTQMQALQVLRSSCVPQSFRLAGWRRQPYTDMEPLTAAVKRQDGITLFPYRAHGPSREAPPWSIVQYGEALVQLGGCFA